LLESTSNTPGRKKSARQTASAGWVLYGKRSSCAVFWRDTGGTRFEEIEHRVGIVRA
jgi:hypothetical protein